MTRFADRMTASTYADDPVAGIFEVDPGEKDALWIPERLFLRVSRIAAAYELHTLPLLGGSDPVRLGRLQCDLLLDELAFVADRLHDPLATGVARSVSGYLASRLHRPAWDGFVTVEGE